MNRVLDKNSKISSNWGYKITSETDLISRKSNFGVIKKVN